MDIKKLVLALIGAALLVSVADAQTQTARRAGLDGNPLIEDHDDVYVFPQKAHSIYNQNRVKFDMNAAGANTGTIFSGTGSSAWGVAVGKMGDDAVNDGVYPQAFQTIDGYYSTKVGTADFGLHLGLANGGATDDGADTESSNTDVNLGVGYTVNGDAASHDLSLVIDYGMGEIKDGPEGTGLGVQANYRGYHKNRAGENVDLGVIGQVSYNSTEDKQPNIDAAETSGLFAVAGAGPVFRAGKSTVSVLGAVAYQSNTDAAEDVTGSVVLPGANIAMETPMNDWLTFRGGISYFKTTTSSEPKNGDKSTNSVGATTYALGMSANWQKLDIDITVNRDFLMNGPFLLTGNATANWASQVSATYAW